MWEGSPYLALPGGGRPARPASRRRRRPRRSPTAGPPLAAAPRQLAGRRGRRRRRCGRRWKAALPTRTEPAAAPPTRPPPVGALCPPAATEVTRAIHAEGVLVVMCCGPAAAPCRASRHRPKRSASRGSGRALLPAAAARRPRDTPSQVTLAHIQAQIGLHSLIQSNPRRQVDVLTWGAPGGGGTARPAAELGRPKLHRPAERLGRQRRQRGRAGAGDVVHDLAPVAAELPEELRALRPAAPSGQRGD